MGTGFLNLFFKDKPIVHTRVGLPENHKIYCIGDIHGRLDLLTEVHAKIACDAATFEGVKTLVYLGDYIDRGMSSKSVVDCLLAEPFPDFKKIYLLGNHEQVLLQFLTGTSPSTANDWFKFGGLSTLVSYDVKIVGIPTEKDLDRIRQEFAEKLPPAHWEFFNGLSLFYETDDYYFVHAGIKPKIKLHQQHLEDQLWIRDEFLKSALFHGKIIVHGHTVTDEPEILPNRIGLDTGAYSSGKLTCAVFENSDCRIL